MYVNICQGAIAWGTGWILEDDLCARCSGLSVCGDDFPSSQNSVSGFILSLHGLRNSNTCWCFYSSKCLKLCRGCAAAHRSEVLKLCSCPKTWCMGVLSQNSNFTGQMELYTGRTKTNVVQFPSSGKKGNICLKRGIVELRTEFQEGRRTKALKSQTFCMAAEALFALHLIWRVFNWSPPGVEPRNTQV